MEFRTIGGAEGLKVSAVGIGCNAFGSRCDEAETAAIVEAAIDAGVNFFDTANTYGDGLSEEYIGRALGGRRGDVVVATKFGMRDGASRAVVEASVEASLKRLGTDWIDLYQLHKPDPATPIAETLAALDKLVRDGKVRFIGCSNFSGAQLAEALATSKEMGVAEFVTAQNPWSLLQRDIEADLVPLCRERGIGILPYYPLQRGLLTGKYRPGEPPPPGTRLAGGGRAALLNEENFRRIAALTAFAEARGHSLLDLAMSWLASRAVVPSVIAGVSKPDQVAANVAAAGWRLGEEEFAAIDEIVPPPQAVAAGSASA